MPFLSEKINKRVKDIETETPQVEFLSSGVYGLDNAVGGGFPRKRVTEITGEGASGKTTIALICAQKVIANGGYVAYIETERSLDYQWIERIGISADEIYDGNDNEERVDHHFHVSHPLYLEEALELLLNLYRDDKYDLIVLDSFAATPMRVMVEAVESGKAMEKSYMGKRAFLGSLFKDLFFSCQYEGNAAVVVINQVYDKYDQTFYNKLKPKGGSVQSSGGKTFEFLSGLRIFMKDPKPVPAEKNAVLESGEKIEKGAMIGKEHGGMIHKNKTGKPVPQDFRFRLMIVPWSYINIPWDIVETSKELGVLEQRGHFWFYQNERVADSQAAMEELLMTDGNLMAKIEANLVEAIAASRQAKDKTVNGGQVIKVEASPVTTLSGSENDLILQSESS